MKATKVFSLITVLAAAGCTDKPAQQASVPQPAPPPGNAPVWDIGEDIAGKEVMIDGKVVVIPEDVAEAKRKMDAVAKEEMDKIDALEKKRLARFNDPDMTP